MLPALAMGEVCKALAAVAGALAGVLPSGALRGADDAGPDDAGADAGDRSRATVGADDRAQAASEIRRAVASLSGADLGLLFGEIARVRAQLEGLQVAVLAEATDRGVVAESSCADPGAWARERCWDAGVGMPAGTANALRRAVDLRRPTQHLDARPLFAAVVAGAVPVAMARPVAKELDRLAGTVAPALWDTAATELVGWAAQGAGATDLRRAGQAIAANYGVDAFEEEQVRAHRLREVSAWVPDGGGWLMTVRTDNEGKAVFDAAFDALAAPMPATTVTDADGAVVEVTDARTPGQRRHDALAELARVVATDPGLLGSKRPVSAAKAQITVTMDYDRLTTRLGDDLSGGGERSCGGRGYGVDGHGTPLTPSTVRRLACDAQLIPAVLAADGAILDWGRAKRLATSDQVTYLRHRDRGCVFPGCDRPPAWCEAHHLDEWDVDHGPTDVANLALLCGRHHTVVHTTACTAPVCPPATCVGRPATTDTRS